MAWYKTAWKWILGALSVLGAIAIYILLSKDDTDKKVEELENKINEKEKEIQEWEEKRADHIKNAEVYGDEGRKLDKEIEKKKAERENLSEKREKMKNIFDKYNGSNENG